MNIKEAREIASLPSIAIQDEYTIWKADAFIEGYDAGWEDGVRTASEQVPKHSWMSKEILKLLDEGEK